MLKLSNKWITDLLRQSESGMSYQIASVKLNDGTRFDQVVIVDGAITKIRGRDDIPFGEESISQIIVTHDKWDFNAES